MLKRLLNSLRQNNQGMEMNGVPSERAFETATKIERAYGEVPYPGDDRLVEGFSLEASEIADFLKGRRWQDLQPEELLRNRQSLFFMTPEAIRFYLPAYLRTSVLHYEKADTIPGSIMFLLRPTAPNDSDAEKRFRARFGSLNKQQCEAIRAFLEYIHDEHAEDFPNQSGTDEASVLLKWWSTAP